MAGTTTRRDFIEKLLAKMKPDNASDVLGQLEEYLDKRGVERKEFDMDKAKGVLEDAVEGINAALAPLSDEIPEDLAPRILALVMGTLADMPMEAPVEEEVMQEDEEEEEPMPERIAELTEQVKALAEDNTQTLKDFEVLVEAVTKMADGYRAVAPLVEKAGDYTTMLDRIARLESEMRKTPRRATQAKETEVDKPDTLSEIKKGTDGKKTILGLPVKE